MWSKKIEDVRLSLSNANFNWPNDGFSPLVKHSSWLEQRLALAVGESEILFCTAETKGEHGSSASHLSAIIFTTDFVICGYMRPGEANKQQYQPKGDVQIVPRSKIESLTVHHVGSFSDEGPSQVIFTANYEGIGPVLIDGQRYAEPGVFSTVNIFALLKQDLASTIRGTPL